jgi:hypothetical protein
MGNRYYSLEKWKVVVVIMDFRFGKRGLQDETKHRIEKIAGDGHSMP